MALRLEALRVKGISSPLKSGCFATLLNVMFDASRTSTEEG